MDAPAPRPINRAPLIHGWYIPTADDSPRWILAISKPSVIYSRGGDKHYECLIASFKRWMRQTNASLRTPEVKS